MLKLGVGKLSVVINTRNEEKNIAAAIASIKSLADEIVVVDMESTDETKKIAKSKGAKVFNFKQAGYVEPARNFAIEKASSDWILILDADERIPKLLARKIKSILKSPKADFYRLPRKNFIFKKWIKNSGWWPDYNIRLFKKGKAMWSEIIHSVPETSGKGLDMQPLEENAIVHNHYDSVEEYVKRLNRYTTVQAENLKKDGYEFYWGDVITKPSEEFLRRYFALEGYKDGLHGLAVASLQSFSELVLYLKIWQIDGFEKENISVKKVISKMKEIDADHNYWYADTLLKEGGGLVDRVKRKFKIS